MWYHYTEKLAGDGVMFKKISVLLILLLTVSCSNIEKKDSLNNQKMSQDFYEKIQNEKLLNELLTNIKNELEKNKTNLFTSSIDMPMKKRFITNELNMYDFSKMNISYTKPIISNKRAENTVAFRFDEQITYFKIGYELKNKEWKIVEFEERR
ncbi:MAG: hypothetical protein RSF36_00995 [Cetobacterium sp.]